MIEIKGTVVGAFLIGMVKDHISSDRLVEALVVAVITSSLTAGVTTYVTTKVLEREIGYLRETLTRHELSIQEHARRLGEGDVRAARAITERQEQVKALQDRVGVLEKLPSQGRSKP